jgi:putative hydrolase of the HAD superfamily
MSHTNRDDPLRPQAVETLFLDAGGVLLFPNWERVAAALTRHGAPVEGARLAAAEPHAKRELDAPERMWRSNDDSRGWVYFNLVLAHAGVPRNTATDDALAELRAYHARHNLWESVPAEVVPTLGRLRQMQLRLVVVSNANGTLKHHLVRLGMSHLFDHVFDSHEEGVEKPDPRFFELALERSGAPPETTIHVGDLYEVDVLGARAAGLDAVLVDPADLYPEVDCPRVASLSELADRLTVTH